MTQVFAQRVGGEPNTGVVSYGGVSTAPLQFSSDETLGEQPWPTSGTFRNLVVTVGAAPGSGKSWTFTLRVNGSDTSLTITISDSDTTARDVANTATITAGDRVSWKVTPSGTPTSAGSSYPHISVEFDSDTTGESAYGQQSYSVVTAATTMYAAPFSSSRFTAAATDVTEIIPCDGTITATYVRYQTAPNGATLVFYKNGTKQDGTGGTVDTRVTFTGNPYDDANATYSLSAVAGDLVYLALEKNTADWPVIAYGIRFVADTDGQSIFAGGAVDNPSVGAVEYHQAGQHYGNIWEAVESTVAANGGVSTFSLSGFRARCTVAPGSGKSYTLTLRRDAGSPSGTPTIVIADTDTDGEDLSSSLSIADGDTFDMMQTPSGTPAGSVLRWSFIMDVEDPPIRGSFVGGESTTVNVSRATAWGLDGASNVHSEEGVHKVFGASSVTEYLELEEMSAAPTGVANKARIWIEDNGSGKSRLMVQFGTGAAQQIAIEP